MMIRFENPRGSRERHLDLGLRLRKDKDRGAGSVGEDQLLPIDPELCCRSQEGVVSVLLLHHARIHAGHEGGAD
jgi:hypothetical protein